MQGKVSDKDIAKRKKEETEERKKSAMVFSTASKDNKIDAEKNIELVEDIKSRYSELDEDGTTEVKRFMKELGIKSFKEPDTIPTKHLEQVLDHINTLTEG